MAKNIIILGAGASVPYGAPVMRNFLDEARELYATNLRDDNDRKSFENVFAAISRLQAVHSKSEFDLINLESIFTTFELSKTLGRLPGTDHAHIGELIDDLKRLIVVTLEHTISIPQSQGRIGFSGPLSRFLEVLKERQSGNPLNFSVLTFNYDLIMDAAILMAGISVDYGVPYREDWSGITLPLLKLHGSLNWGVEKESNEIVPWFLHDCLQRLSPRIKNGRGYSLFIGNRIHEMAHYSRSKKQINTLPFIVPPSWNKADSHNQIATVWNRAAQELSEADSIYVIGYSLPNTDSFFRQLYALGTVGDTLLKRFWVYNPDPSREDVFRGMLGPGAKERFKFFRIIKRDEVAIRGETVFDAFDHIYNTVLKNNE